ncbi:hypothetical protein MMC17_006384 [Xylographa soralifera]|nr:hypothetical protein [Xylographa soralifera]
MPVFTPSPSSSNPGKSPLSSSSKSDGSYVIIRHSEKDRSVPDRMEYVQGQSLAVANEDFKGRDDVLKEMDRRLLPPRSETDLIRPSVYNICGPAGIGKTQIALHFFHSRKAKFDVALWVQANSKDSLYVAFRQIATKLGLDTQDLPEDIVSREQVKGWLANPFQYFLSQRGSLMTWLLVFDNADDLESILQFWPFNGQGSVVVTSRDPAAQTKNYFGEIGTTIDCLPENEAVALLKSRLELGSHQHVESEESYLKVVQTLECWPLAIVQVTGTITKRKLTLSDFLEEYKEALQRAGYHETKAVLFRRIYSHLILTSQPSRAGLLDYPQTPSAYSKAMMQLESGSIVTRGRSIKNLPTELLIHPLIQDVVRGQLFKADQNGIVAVFNATVRLLSTIWPFETLPNYGYQEVNKSARRMICDRNLPHIKNLRQIYELLPLDARHLCANTDFLNLLNELGWLYYQRFNPEEAFKCIQVTLAVEKDCIGERHPRIVVAQYGTWNAIAKEINVPQLAMETGKQSLAIRERLFLETGVPDSQIAASYTSMGLTYLMNGRFDKAEELVNQSITIRSQMQNFSRLQLYSPLMYLSLIYLYTGNSEVAADQLLEALHDREVMYGIDDHESMRTGTLLAYLGKVRTIQGYFNDGLKYYQRATKSWKDAGGEHDYSMGRLHYWVAVNYHHLKSLDIAITTLDKAIEIFGRSRYHYYELARALFLKSQVLRESKDETGSIAALESCAELRRQFCGDNLVALEDLSIEHFDEYVALWNR